MSENIDTDTTNTTPSAFEGVDSSLITEKVQGFVKDGSLDMGALLKSYNEGQSFIGKNIPDANTPPEIAKAFYAKMGVPESTDNYDWTPPEGIQIEEDGYNKFKETAHKLNFSNAQLGGAMTALSELIASDVQKRNESLEQGAKDCYAIMSAENQWGKDYQENNAIALKKMEELGVLEVFKNTGATNLPEVLKAFYSISDIETEQRVKGSSSTESKEERIKALKANPAYTQVAHEDHAKVVAELNSLYDSK